MIERPRARTREGEIEEDEAEQDRRLAFVDRRPEAVWVVLHEISDRHLARRDERGDAREQPERDENPADQLDRTGGDQQSRKRARPREGRREGEEFLRR